MLVVGYFRCVTDCVEEESRYHVQLRPQARPALNGCWAVALFAFTCRVPG
jgi:hypothetical protein